MRYETFVVVSSLSVCCAASAGPLDPPGAPAPSYKTLDQANPGTPLSEVSGDTNALHVITSGGRYFFDGDITGPGAGMRAIEINTSAPVEIDFNGFAILGDGTETLAAIDLGSGTATVHGGSIVVWGAAAITEIDSTLTLRNMTMRVIQGAELMSLNRRTRIEDCVFDANSGPINLNGGGVGGTQTGIVIRDCQFSGMPEAISGPDTAGVQILDCAFSGVGSASELTRVVVGDDALISRCTFVGGGETGVDAGNGLRIEDCVFRGLNTGNPTSGIIAGMSASVSGCASSGYSGNGVSVGDQSVVRDCSVSATGDFGIRAGANAVISGNTLQSNTVGGIRVTFGSRVVGNALRANGIGIEVIDDAFVGDNTLDSDNVAVNGSDSVIDGNTFTDSGSGIELNGAGNVVRRNSFGSTTITGTSGFTGNLVFTIRTSADFQSSGPFDNLSF